jgi:hypothetical protein
VKMHIEHCFSHDKENLHKHRADSELFARFDQIRPANDGEFLSDKVKLNLVAVPNLGDALVKDLSFWIQGVEQLASAGANSPQSVKRVECSVLGLGPGQAR